MGGALPAEVSELRVLPGIGRYTAGASASIAFGRPAPVLDGNVMRLITRLLDLDDDVTLSATQNKLWGIAADWLPVEGAGEFNQALMELGQKICKPKNPHCENCPLQLHCRAFAQGTQLERPVRSKRAPKPHYDVTAGLIRDCEQRLLIGAAPAGWLARRLMGIPRRQA